MAADNFTLRVCSQEATGVMVVNKAGNVGIGTAGPGAKLHVAQAGVAASAGMRLTNNDAVPDGRNVYLPTGA